MGELTRAEIDAFWESWLQVNRDCEATGDWRPMAEWYAEDATYGWMYTPDEHFMAVGREEIRELAIGQEMAGLDGWHYDYQATLIDEKTQMVVGFWKQRSGFVDVATGVHTVLMKVQRQVFNHLMEWLKPGVTVRELSEQA